MAHFPPRIIASFLTLCSFASAAQSLLEDVPKVQAPDRFATIGLSTTGDAPQIISTTESFSILDGSSTNLHVEAVGTEPLRFVWQRNRQPVDGATNATLVLTNIGIEHAGTYDVTVSNSFGVRQSSPIVVTVNVAPKIHNVLTNISLDAGKSIRLQASVSGSDPLTYRWFQEGRLLSSVGFVQLRNVQATDSGPVWLVLSNAFAVVSNIVADLTIVPRIPFIARQPTDQELRTNVPVLFSVAVVGTEPMRFQWLKNGEEISSATNRGFIISNPSEVDLAEYSVVVANSVGNSTSAVGRLTDQPLTNSFIEWPSIDREVVVTGIPQVTGITHAGDASKRLFVIEQSGRVRIIENDLLMELPFLDLTDRVLSGGERGLLGIAFAPDFKESGEFYLNYTRTPDGATVVSRFRCDPGSNQAKTNEVVLLTIAQPAANHNGGHLAFGPDGYLYIATGDGGGGNDTYNNGQNTNSLLGKLLRIDVSGSQTNYSIPPTNPFVDREGYRPEIWALGLRNPWRFSFDRLSGDMFIADVGELAREEVNFQRRDSEGGENYGWPIFEANLRTPKPIGSLNTNEFIFPIKDYPRSLGASITGGYISRNAELERMWGVYFYGDYVSGRFWQLRRDHSATSETNQWISPVGSLPLGRATTFGEDEGGNIYAAISIGGNSQVVRLVDSKIANRPVFSPNPGSYTGVQTVTLTADPSAIIHYRLDDEIPTESDPFIFSGGTMIVASNQTINARSFREDLQPSVVTAGKFTITIPDQFTVQLGEGVLTLKWSSAVNPVGRLERSFDLENWTDVGEIGAHPVNLSPSNSEAFFRVVGE